MEKLNESTSYFVYATSTTRDRCDYAKCKQIWIDRQNKLNWVESKSDIDWKHIADNEVYLYTAEMVPGQYYKRFISCTTVNTELMSMGYQKTYSKTITQTLYDSLELHGSEPVVNPFTGTDVSHPMLDMSSPLGECITELNVFIDKMFK